MSKRKLAIVGASGFVGSALCERLFFEGRRDFTAFTRSSGNAARIARLPLPIQELDLLNKDQLFQALADYSTIVNCSRGDDVLMLRGLKNLLEAAKHHRIRKFIHISSVAIYGDDPPLESTTEACLPVPAGNEYGAMKLKQDHMVMALHRAGIPTYILCPSNIAGPYSTFVFGLTARLARGPMLLVDDGNYPCNLIHVDNLVEAILTAERSDVASGERYFVNETQPVSWKQYFEDLARLVGFQCRFLPVSREEVLARLRPPQEKNGLLEHMKIALSGEFRSGLTLMPVLRGLNNAASNAFQNLPLGVQQKLRSRLERPLSVARQHVGPRLDEQYVRVQVRRAYHSPEKLIDRLRYQPALDYRQGLETTASWLRFTRVA